MNTWDATTPEFADHQAAARRLRSELAFSIVGAIGNLPAVLRTTARRWASRLAKGRVRRQSIHQLSALDDRTLADIGLHRSQIPGVVADLLAADVTAAPPTAHPVRTVGGAPATAAANDDGHRAAA